MPKTRAQPQQQQRGLWDRLTGKGHASSPVAPRRPYSGEHWPDPETAVVVLGEPSPRLYAVVGRMECGREFTYALLVGHDQRQNAASLAKATILVERLGPAEGL